ncbi:hypothetical protein PAHAL_7G135600 [Panicum hallii]|uniref:Uncharacterized protein n=1 Tax=Panicum hallii TaxID=206008 RepID=A0A2T8IC49_9POAL|nr:hypothetical protein PAHAL_7G135600 [Panicum hallii]
MLGGAVALSSSPLTLTSRRRGIAAAYAMNGFPRISPIFQVRSLCTGSRSSRRVRLLVSLVSLRARSRCTHLDKSVLKINEVSLN